MLLLIMLLLDLSVACFLLTHVYHLISCMLSPNHLACYYLTIPTCYVMTYPDYYQSFEYLVACYISPPYHAITWHPAWYTWLVIIIFTGILTYYLVSWSVTWILYSCFTCS